MSQVMQRKEAILLPISRMEALSDGVFAIVMTLLVLDITLPELGGIADKSELIQGLAGLSPKFLSYAISFIVLGNFWHMHHATFTHIKRLDTGLIWRNIFLLMFVALVPFSTSVLSEYKIASMGNIPFVLYISNMLLIIIMRALILVHATGHYPLADSDADFNVLRKMKRVMLVACFASVLAIGVSFINVIAAFCLLILMVISAFLAPRLIEGFK
jgi:uncharacterized membrane protein